MGMGKDKKGKETRGGLHRILRGLFAFRKTRNNLKQPGNNSQIERTAVLHILSHCRWREKGVM
jgi:hypothetical protein